MPQRKIILTPRPARRRPVPAYQVRRGGRAAADDAADALSDSGETEFDSVRTDTAAFEIPNFAAAPESVEQDIPEESADEPEAVAEAPAIDAPDEIAAVDDADETPEPVVDDAVAQDVAVAEQADESVAVADELPDVDAVSDDTTVIEAADGSEDYADVVRSVEEAAARERGDVAEPAEPQEASAGADTAADVAAGAVTVLTPDAVRRQRAAQGGGSLPPDDGGVGIDEPSRPRRWKRWLIALGIVIGVLVIAALAYVLYIALAINDAFDKAHVDPTPYTLYTVNEQGTPVAVPTEQLAQYLPNWDEKDPINLLLIGIDFRNGDEEPARSDSIIIMRIDPATKEVSMMSLPRDLLVTIPDYGDEKINAAFAYGEDARTGGGPSLLAETISYNFNIQINYFVTVDFAGFRKIIDTLGGITIDVNAPIKDDQYPSEDFGLTRVYFPTGLQKMDGETALRYARTRHGDNDIARSERQQQVLMAMREKGSTLNVDLLLNARSLIESMGDSFTTDLSFNQLLALANLARDIDPADIARVNLWEEGALVEHNPEYEGDAFYMVLDWDIAGDLFDTYFPMKTADTTAGAASTSTTSSTAASSTAIGNLDIPIIVRDDTSSNTGGAIASNLLEDAGFTTVSQEMGVNVMPTTTIYDYVSDPETAEAIARQLGLDASAVVPGSGGTGIVVSVGDDLVSRFGP
ncbi:MAG: LCP family protein [Thermomicrobiales bacterium]|nr:LCP family protein [Thermomicrobiales bacterium]